MEERTEESCSIIYFCSSVKDDLHELYHKNSPPKAPPTPALDAGGLQQAYLNVCALLDEDQGGFEEVFISSREKDCLERLDTHANAVATIILIELRNTSSEVNDKKRGSYSFLRSLSGEINGARFQKHVMPFVILTWDQTPSREANLDPTIVTNCLQGGALDILRSPLRHDDINRMIGHFKDENRPPARLIGAPMAQNLVDSIRDASKPPRVAGYRPDEGLSPERRAAVEKAVVRWHFPAQDFNMDELTYAACFMVEHLLRSPDLRGYGLERPQLVAFILAARRQYKHEREVYYHNWRHAVDVTQCTFCFLLDLGLCPAVETPERNREKLTPLERMLTPLDGLILLVSAIGHDVGHPGVNNAFLVACNHPLAQTYNDKSVLENYHCAAYSQLIRRHWPSLHQIAGFRATMISTILATDMQRHFEYMTSLGELKDRMGNEAGIDDWSAKDRDHTRELIMALLIKAADISNVARPFEISSRWAKTLMNEFSRQGDLESELQIPTCLFGGPPNTEDILAAAQSQKGFMSLFGHPLFSGIADIMPVLSGSVRELENNQSVWDQKIVEEKQRRQPQEPSERAHFSGVTEAEVREAQEEHRKSEPAAVPLQIAQPPSTPTKRVAIEEPEVSPSSHAAHELRQQLASGLAFDEDKRSSMPFIGSPGGVSSRRSSKDIALDHLQQITHQSLSPGSRRGSADAGWQIHQSYPNSRRGSKDESLTTIVVTSGGTPNRRSSPSSPGAIKTSPSKPPVSKRQSGQSSTRQPVARAMPSPKSQPSTAVSAAAVPHSPPSLPLDSPPAALTSIPSTEDPFMEPGTWPDDLDGSHRASIQAGLPEALPPPPPQLGVTKSEESRIETREADDEGAVTPKKPEGGLRESRSRSRLRGLKFWKRRRGEGAAGVDEPGSPGGSS